MAAERDYLPCFSKVPQSWDGRWNLLREFARRWHGLELREAGVPSSQAAEEESKLGVLLPPAFREWIAFAGELKTLKATSIFRDCYEVARLESHPAYSLLIQGEGDLYWSVKEEDLSNEDPPVHMYYLDYEARRFEYGGFLSPHITSFVLGHMGFFLRGKGGGCCVPVKNPESLCSELKAAFCVSARFGHLDVFEMNNVIAMIIPPNVFVPQHCLLVEIWRPIPSCFIPGCILDHTSGGGCFHGSFAPGTGNNVTIIRGG